MTDPVRENALYVADKLARLAEINGADLAKAERQEIYDAYNTLRVVITWGNATLRTLAAALRNSPKLREHAIDK